MPEIVPEIVPENDTPGGKIMPRLVHMTWIPSEHRWKKMYKGQRYCVSTRELGTGPTQAESLVTANQWWERKRAEIDGPRPDHVRDSYGKALGGLTPDDLASASARGELVGRILAEGAPAADVVSRDAVDRIVGLGHYADTPLLRQADDAIRVALLARAAESLRPTPGAPPERTVGALAERWIRIEKNKLRTGKAGPSRVNMNRICLNHFTAWLGHSTPVDVINGAKWTETYEWLCDQLDQGVWANSHCDRIFAIARRFVEWLWEIELIDLPRNLRKKEYAFMQGPKKIMTWTAEELQALWSVVSGQTRLQVLLMLNCGMTGIDISDLRQDEVDWRAGVVTRQRSKTRKHHETTFPK
jgi:hypothetical protein